MLNLLFGIISSLLVNLSICMPISSIHLPKLNASLSEYQCRSSPAWDSRTFMPTDCQIAISYFFADEIIHWGDTTFEFITTGAHPAHHLPSQYLPRKYTFGKWSSFCHLTCTQSHISDSCTMAIASLSTFETEELPGVPEWRLFPKSDVSSYGKMFTAVRDIADNCLSKYLAADGSPKPGLQFVSQTGWEAVGTQAQIVIQPLLLTADYFCIGVRRAIGVFLWATNSPANMQIHQVNAQREVLFE